MADRALLQNPVQHLLTETVALTGSAQQLFANAPALASLVRLQPKNGVTLYVRYDSYNQAVNTAPTTANSQEYSGAFELPFHVGDLKALGAMSSAAGSAVISYFAI